MDKSRSIQSRTNTTSGAPAPSLAPATIAFLNTSNEIIELLHSEAADPNNLWLLNARDQDKLQKLSEEVLPFLKGKERALLGFLEEAESERVHASEKTKKFWRYKREGIQRFLDVFSLADNKTGAQLDGEDRTKRDAYFVNAQKAWEVDLKQVLEKLEKAIIGPYVLGGYSDFSEGLDERTFFTDAGGYATGDQFSIADLHVIAWLSRIAKLVGASLNDDGGTVVSKINERSGGGGCTNKRTGVYWDVVRERPSWRRLL